MTAPAPLRGPITRRILDAMLLRRELYESVAADPLAGSQAAGVICLCAVAQPNPLTPVIGAWAFVVAILFGLARWWVFTGLVWPVARLIAWRPVEFRRLLRCLGFAEAPAIVNVFGVALSPEAQSWLGAAASAGILATTVVAVRAACNVSTNRALVIGIISFAVYLVLGVISSVIIQMT